MDDSATTTSGAKPDLGVLLGLGATTAPAFYAPEFDRQPSSDDMSVVGVMLLTSLSVLMAILGVVLLGVFLIGAWWVVIHIPVPLVVTQLIAKLGI